MKTSDIATVDFRPGEAEGVNLKLMKAMSSWPLLLTAMPSTLMRISYTVDGETVERQTCSEFAVLSVEHDGRPVFGVPYRDLMHIVDAQQAGEKTDEELRHVAAVADAELSRRGVPRCNLQRIDEAIEQVLANPQGWGGVDALEPVVLMLQRIRGEIASPPVEWAEMRQRYWKFLADRVGPGSTDLRTRLGADLSTESMVAVLRAHHEFVRSDTSREATTVTSANGNGLEECL